MLPVLGLCWVLAFSFNHRKWISHCHVQWDGASSVMYTEIWSCVDWEPGAQTHAIHNTHPISYETLNGAFHPFLTTMNTSNDTVMPAYMKYTVCITHKKQSIHQNNSYSIMLCRDNMLHLVSKMQKNASIRLKHSSIIVALEYYIFLWQFI